MSKKLLVTTGPLVREIAKPAGLKKAIDAMRADGMEIITFDKSEHDYTLEDLEGVISGVKAAIIGSEPWGEEKFRIAPDLKAVCRFGVGFDAVDLEKAKQYGVMATNARVPELSYSVAECALTLTLTLIRRMAPSFADLHRGEWNQRQGRQLRGKTVGIVGFGAIGQVFAEVLQGFRVRILACDPSMNREAAKKWGVEAVAMDQLLAESDIVSLSAPNTKENRHMFNAALFAKMKVGALFINTARGAMVDEAALYAALTSGKLAGAGLDVWEKEPTPAGNPLLELENVVPLPHMAAETAECALAVAMCVVGQVRDVMAGRTPINLLNP